MGRKRGGDKKRIRLAEGGKQARRRENARKCADEVIGRGKEERKKEESQNASNVIGKEIFQ